MAFDFGKYLSSAEADLLEGRTPQLTFKAFQDGWVKSFGEAAVEEVIIPRRTYMRRKAKKERLNEAETDRALRVARIAIHAARVFHNAEKGQRWLQSPNRKFASRTPFSLLKTDLGCELVEETLHQIEHGIFA